MPIEESFHFSNSLSFFFYVETDVIMSCTFDLPDENCPIKDQHDWQIETRSQSNQTQPVGDHTRGGNRKILFFFSFNPDPSILNIRWKISHHHWKLNSID
jgi:hypothetical protein